MKMFVGISGKLEYPTPGDNMFAATKMIPNTLPYIDSVPH